MTKKAAQQYFLNKGFQSSYSGHTRTLYVKGISELALDMCSLITSFKIEAQLEEELSLDTGVD